VQPKYSEDLFNAGATLGKALENAGDQYQTLRMSLPSRENLESLYDVIEFTIDICSSMFTFLSIYPEAAIHLQLSELETKIAAFYHSTIVGLSEIVNAYSINGLLPLNELEYCENIIKVSRHRCILTFRSIIEFTCITPVLSNNTTTDKRQVLEQCLCIFTTILQERTFLIDYNKKFPISDDFDMFSQLGICVDPTRKLYILDALCNTTEEESMFSGLSFALDKTSSPVATAAAAGRTSLDQPPSDVLQSSKVPSVPQPGLPKNDVEVDSMISSVLDLLPYLGKGFVLKCLEHYQFMVEEVVNAILEGNLAPHLAELDQSMGIDPVKQSEKPPIQEPSVLLQGRSVYDDDEFDINTKDVVDLSKVHRGKRNKGDFKQLIDDKTDINSMRDRFSKLGIVTDVEVMEADSREYEDEYDDTYDDLAVGQEEPDSRDDGEGGRNFVLPVALGGGKISRKTQVEEDDQEDENIESDDRRNLNFVRNPEEIRQENERRRQEKMSRQGGNKKPQTHQPVKDVVGKPKGQGQDKQVLINRARKNTNKGKSHRVGADRKMAKGMF